MSTPSADHTPAQTSEQRLQLEAEAAVFRRLVAHLQERTDVQNIDLMTLSGFCRNCLSKWYRAELEARGGTIEDLEARERIYGMPYAEWKSRYQTPRGQSDQGGSKPS